MNTLIISGEQSIEEIENMGIKYLVEAVQELRSSKLYNQDKHIIILNRYGECNKYATTKIFEDGWIYARYTRKNFHCDTVGYDLIRVGHNKIIKRDNPTDKECKILNIRLFYGYKTTDPQILKAREEVVEYRDAFDSVDLYAKNKDTIGVNININRLAMVLVYRSNVTGATGIKKWANEDFDTIQQLRKEQGIKTKDHDKLAQAKEIEEIRKRREYANQFIRENKDADYDDWKYSNFEIFVTGKQWVARRTAENTNTKTFDWIDFYFTLSGENHKKRFETAKRFNKDFLRVIKNTLESDKKFLKFGIPINCLKVDSAIVSRDGILTYKLSIKNIKE